MKKQLLLLFTLISVFFSSAQQEKNDLAFYNLKGKVKSVNEIEYEAVEKFGDLEKSNKTARYYREFNNAGMELQYLQENYDDGEKEKFVRTTKYENGKMIEIKEEEDDDVQYEKYRYNQQGLVESIDEVGQKGNLQYRQKNKYNAQDLLIQADSYKADGTLEMKMVRSYNAKKQLVKEENYDGGGKLTNVNTYAYDSRGNVVEKSDTNYEEKAPKPYINRYVYNDKGQKIEERNSISGLDKKEIYEYNENGDVVRKRDQYGTEVKKVYTYDAQNNWIKCVTVTNDRSGDTKHEIAERQIKYY